MSDTSTTLSLAGLTPLEAAELKAALAKAGCDPDKALHSAPEQGAVGGAKKGEPFTILAIVALSQTAMTGLAIYLSTRKKTSRHWVKLSHTSPSGEVLTYEMEIESHERDAIKAEVMEKIAGLKISLPDAGSGTQ